MKLTTWRELLGPFLPASAISFALARVIGAITSTVPNVPIAAVNTMLALTVVLGILTIVVRPRLLRVPGREPLDALTAGKVVALALASSRAAAVLGGIFFGWLAAGWLVDALNTPFAKTRVLHAGVCIVLSAGLLAVGLILERACVIKQRSYDNNDPSA